MHICRSVYFPYFASLFLEDWLNTFKIKIQSARNSFAALKNCIMLNVSLTKTEQNT